VTGSTASLMSLVPHEDDIALLGKRAGDWTSLKTKSSMARHLVDWKTNSLCPTACRFLVSRMFIDHSKFDKEGKFKDVRRNRFRSAAVI